MQSEIQELVDNSEQSTKAESVVRYFFRILGLTLIWAFVLAAALGSLAAAVWTIIPTELLAWGASSPNLLGYVSHCSFAPTSTTILSFVSFVGILISWKLKKGREMARGVFLGTAGGLLFGLTGGIDITMFIGMGAGIGIGVVLGIIIGLFRRQVS